jgi:signal transduction histidine kinase
MSGTFESTRMIDRVAIRRAAKAAALEGVAGDATADAVTDRLVTLIESAGESLVPGTSPVLMLRLIDALRFHLLEGWAATPEPPSAEIVLATLGLVEKVATALRRATEEDGATGTMPDGYEFAAGVAHDLRSPLTSILFLAETLHSGQSGPTNDSQRRQLGIIYSAALGLVSVASDIIELVRGGDGLTEREPTLFSVTEILESVHDIVRPMAEEKSLGVHLFPPAVDHRWGFPLALSRVLLNLTTNGLKFTDSGFVEIAVRATSPSRLEFSVRDTGKGYSPEALETLYDPYRRSGGKTFGFSGTGLGLAISRKLVTAMGSALDVETRPKWGSRFFFEVDLPPGPEIEPPAAA